VLGRRPLIDRLLRQRALVVPFKRNTVSEYGYFVIVDKTAAHKPAVQALVQWLLAQARLAA
jgi:DNA-binding transcriptional LysR family regulator